MFRRKFVQLIAAVGTASMASIAKAGAHATQGKTVIYVVKGFSCVTCAVGLDTMLQKQKGVAWSQSAYPEGIVRIHFDPKTVAENSLKAFISEMGFTVTAERGS